MTEAARGQAKAGWKMGKGSLCGRDVHQQRLIAITEIK
jgi:hypothetical protein